MFVLHAECETLHIQPPLRRDSEETRVGSVVTYWCDRLYHLEGTMVYRSLVCTETGQWNAQLPHCQEDPCECVLLMTNIPILLLQVCILTTQIMQ